MNEELYKRLKKAFEKTEKEYKDVDFKAKMEVYEFLANIGGRTLK